MKKVLLNGADGKMGTMIADIIKNNPDFGLEISFERTWNNKDKPIYADFDIIIDYSSPESAAEMFELAKQKRKAFFTGVTGLPETMLNAIKSEKSIPSFYATNASLGVFYFGKLAKYTAELYKNYKRAMREIHHIHKKDAPSGTARTLADLIEFPYDKIESIREGEVVGTHEVIFESPYEEITISHKALNRKLFAESSVIEAAWLIKQKPGFYSVEDYVNSNKSTPCL
jgi:4-hydroxy-tetrahydrodipicolinate reductase